MTEMGSIITLFRLRLHKDWPLLAQELDPRLAQESDHRKLKEMMEAMENSPYYEDQESVWLVGDVFSIDDESWYFKFGRTTSEESEYYDKDSGSKKLLEAVKENHTLVYIDIKLKIVGIVHNSDLASDISFISKRLELLLMKSLEFNISLGIINNPFDFIGQIKSADSVKSFSITYGLPNSKYDTTGLHQTLYKIIAIYMRGTDAEESTVTVKSKAGIRNREALENIRAVAISVNALGHEVKAKIEKDGEVKEISMYSMPLNTKNSSFYPVEAESSPEPLGIMNALRYLFRLFALQ